MDTPKINKRICKIWKCLQSAFASLQRRPKRHRHRRHVQDCRVGAGLSAPPGRHRRRRRRRQPRREGHWRWRRRRRRRRRRERPARLGVALGGQGAGRAAGPGLQLGLAVVLVVGGDTSCASSTQCRRGKTDRYTLFMKRLLVHSKMIRVILTKSPSSACV